MGLIVKGKKITEGFNTDVYVKIDSIRAGMGEEGLITCSCGEWFSANSRSAGEDEYKANVNYHIPDNNIAGNHKSVIDAVYPALKTYFESLGYEVLDDNNCYAEELANKE